MGDYYSVVFENEDIYHHGILGQRWGVRRFQNKDGTLTKAGQERYSDDDDGGKKSDSKNYKVVKSNSDSSKQNSMTPEQKERAKKILAGAAIGMAVGLGLGAAAYYYTHGQTLKHDITLPEGQLFQRISPAGEKDLHDVFYASFGEHDNNRYAGMLPQHYENRGAAEILKKQFAHNGEVKIAGHDTCEKIFKECFSDIERKAYFGNDYKLFNQGVVARNNPMYQKAYETFFNRLKELGYAGFIDINDQEFSGYNARAPLILFNDGNYKMENVTKIVNDGEKLIEQYKDAVWEQSLKSLSSPAGLEELAVYGALGGVGVAQIASNVQTKKDETKTKKSSKSN